MATSKPSVLRHPLGALLTFLFPFWYGPDRKYFPEEHYMRGPGPKWRKKHLAEPGQGGS
jgi:hypothetical protein